MSFGIAGCQRRKGTPKRGVREGKKQLKKREPGRSTLKAQARVQEGYTLVSVVYTRARTMFVCFSRTACLPRALQCARLSPRGRAPREQSASSERELARMAWRKAVCFSEQLVVRLRPERCPCACVCVYAMRNACSNFLFFCPSQRTSTQCVLWPSEIGLRAPPLSLKPLVFLFGSKQASSGAPVKRL